MVHLLYTEVAKKVGVIPALLLGNIYYWTEKNRANEKHFHDGYYWTYNSMKAFNEQFSYLTERQIRYALDGLKKSGYICTGNYNKSSYDRTLWYAVTKKGCSLLRNGQIDATNLSNEFADIARPIPDILPDNIPDREDILSPSVSSETSVDNIKATPQSTEKDTTHISGLPPIILSDKTYYYVTDKDLALWKECYPAVDVEQELRKMAAWCDGNPQKRKTKRGVRSFITNWLSKQHDSGRGTRQQEAPRGADFHHNSKAYKCAAYINRMLSENLQQYVPANEETVQRWAADVDEISRVDGYDMLLVGDVLAFAMHDDFWKDKIADGKSFRRNFVKLLGQMNGGKTDG